MLSKVAERTYWFARYLERVENTARLVGVYDNLLFDLPRGINISWFNLVIINSSSELFFERYKVQDERNVVKFLLSDETNPNSMHASLGMVRENARTTRDAFPPDAWEMINELYLFVRDNIQDGINRTHRRDFLDVVIKGCQQINGLLNDNMSKDAGWQFISLGRNLERADMTTRILDAGSAALLNATSDRKELNPSQLIWGNVLRSTGAATNYRRTMRVAVRGPDVAHFLVTDLYFPRSIAFCIREIEIAISGLPSCHLSEVERIKKLLLVHFEKDEQLGESFRDYLNDLQLGFGKLHEQYALCWFAAA